MPLWPSLQSAIDLVKKGHEAERRGNLEEAANLYRESEKYFLHAAEHDAKKDYTKDSILKKCQYIQSRAKKLSSRARNKDLCNRMEKQCKVVDSNQ